LNFSQETPAETRGSLLTKLGVPAARNTTNMLHAKDEYIDPALISKPTWEAKLSLADWVLLHLIVGKACLENRTRHETSFAKLEITAHND
jgi:hypothetical protein